MHVSRILYLAAVLLVMSGLAGAAGKPGEASAIPVVVELFTSEGCSSCPPADALLTELEQRQPVAGAEVIALGEHVDYWNELGWKDRFSSAQFSARQSQYAHRFGLDSVYTPQMVVDGRSQFVGNDSRRAGAAIAQAAHQVALPPQMAVSFGGDFVEVKVANAGPARLDVMLAITESNLSTEVGRGENHGRLLHHTAVVRTLRKVGTTSGGQFAGRARIALQPDWKRENLRAVVFVQDPSSLSIVGAAQAALK